MLKKIVLWFSRNQPTSSQKKQQEDAERLDEMFKNAIFVSRQVGMTEVTCEIYLREANQYLTFILERSTGRVVGCDSEYFSSEDLMEVTKSYSHLLRGNASVLEFYKETGLVK